MDDGAGAESVRADYRGWLAGLLILALVIGVGVTVWVRFHA